MSGRAAPPHPGIYGVPPPGNRTQRTQKETWGEKTRGDWGPIFFARSPPSIGTPGRLEQAIRDRVESGLVRSKEIESGPSLRRVLHDRGKKRVTPAYKTSVFSKFSCAKPPKFGRKQIKYISCLRSHPAAHHRYPITRKYPPGYQRHLCKIIVRPSEKV